MKYLAKSYQSLVNIDEVWKPIFRNFYVSTFIVHSL